MELNNPAQNTYHQADVLFVQAGPPIPGDDGSGGNLPDNPASTQQPNPDVNQPEGDGIPWFSIIFWIAAAALLIAGLVYLGLEIIKKLQQKDREEKTKTGVIFEVKVPQDNEIEIGVAESLFANLHSIGGKEDGIKKHVTVGNSISFEMVGLPGDIHFFVYTPQKFANLVEKQILGSYQDAEVKVVDEYNIFKPDSKVAFAELEMTDERYYPIKTAEDFTGDPLANVLSTLSKMDEGEGAMIQIVLSPAGNDWQKSGQNYVNKVESNNSDPEKSRINVSQDKLQAISDKANKIGFNTAIRVVASAESQDIAKMHVENIIGAFDQFSNPGINNLKKTKIKKGMEEEFMDNVIYRRMPLKPNTVLNVEELAAVYHFPNNEVTTPNINWLLAKQAPASNKVNSDVDSKDTVWLGNNYYRGQEKRVCFERDDRRRHMYVIGQTGAGKSFNLLRMIMQDIYNGDGVCLMDPHGSLAEMVLDRIPHERAEDVIYFNAADYERPMGFNLMDYQTEQDKHRVVNGFIGLLKKLFDPNDQGIVGPILERAVRNAMLTAMSKKGSSLVEVVRILTDEKWVMDEWVPIIEDDLVRRYWTDQIAKTTEQQKSETLGYIVSKFDRFVTNMAIRNIIGQSESSFDIRDIMDNQKILIVNLSKGLIGEENAQFLGTLIIPKIVSAALSREDTPEEDRKDFYFFVDEFQNFATDEFAAILSEARKYRLCLTMANQYIAQMPEKIRDAVFGNVGTLMVGRVGPEDSEFLEKQFEPVFSANDILNQPNIHAYMKLLTDGKYTTPFSLDPKFGPKFPESGFDIPVDKDVGALIRRLSRLKYGRDVDVVEKEINQRSKLSAEHDSDKKDDKNGAGSSGMPSPLSFG